MKPYFIFLLIIASAISYSQEKLVPANGTIFNVYMNGFENRKPNSPVFVFENGLGMELGNWDSVIDSISRFAPVFTYERSGIGKSNKVFMMPTLKVVADNLKNVLTELNIPPPYVLVGHSMGGLYARGYAGYYPKDISGIVFIDPADFTETKEDWNNIFRTIGVPEKQIDDMLQARLYRKSTIDSVHFGPWSETQILGDLRRSDFIELAGLPLPQVPVYFLVGGKFEVPPERRSQAYNHQQFFIEKTKSNMHRWRLLIDSTDGGGNLIYLPKSGHFVHRDEPKVVINAIKTLLDDLK